MVLAICTFSNVCLYLYLERVFKLQSYRADGMYSILGIFSRKILRQQGDYKSHYVKRSRNFLQAVQSMNITLCKIVNFTQEFVCFL